MPDCLTDDNLVALVEGSLSADELEQVEVHLDWCATCWKAVAQLGRIAVADDDDNDNENDAPAQLQPGALIGRYRVVEVVGAGSMGVVWAADDAGLDRRVALKCLRTGLDDDEETVRTRLFREAKVLAKLQHPNVVTLYDVVEDSRGVFLAVELIDGPDLRTWLSEAERSPTEILQVLRAAGCGLSAAHLAGVVHCDFKPDNVLVGRDGRVLVSDFGLARVGPPRTQAPETGSVGEASRPSIGGTPAYMAPELMTGGDPDARSDQFSFCVTLWEALFGERPGSPATTPLKFASDRFRGRPRTIPKHVVAALLRGLSVDAAERFSGIPALLQALQRRPVTRALRRTAVVAVPLLASGAIAAVLMHNRSACPSASAPVWTSHAQSRIREAFEATAIAAPERAWARVDHAVRRDEDAWSSAYRDACEAEDAATRKYRLACLANRRVSLRATIELLAAASETELQWSDYLVAAHESPSTCLSIAAEYLAPPPPRAAEQEVLEVRRMVSEVYPLIWGGWSERALRRAEQIVGRAGRAEYDPLLVEAYALLGAAKTSAGDIVGAMETQRMALDLAELSHYDVMRAELASDLVGNLADVGRFKQAEELAQVAAAIHERVGASERSRAKLAFRLGRAHFQAGNFERALAAREDALRGWESTDDPHEIDGHRGVASVLRVLKRHREALRHQDRSLSLARARFGEGHPVIGLGLAARGQILVAMGRVQEGLADLARACETLKSAPGAELHAIADAWVANAQALTVAHRWTDALAASHECVAAARSAGGPGSTQLGLCSVLLGTALNGLERPEDAIAPLERALTALALNSPAGAASRLELVRARVATGRLDDRSLQLAREARTVYSRADAFPDAAAELAALTLRIESARGIDSSR